MSPQQQQINELQAQVKELQNFMKAFESTAQISPNVQRAIQQILGSLTLANLSDVQITSPTTGQVLKYDGTNWVNGTDEID